MFIRLAKGKTPLRGKLFTMEPRSPYTCEYCGDVHRSVCGTCGMPPCRCLC